MGKWAAFVRKKKTSTPDGAKSVEKENYFFVNVRFQPISRYKDQQIMPSSK